MSQTQLRKLRNLKYLRNMVKSACGDLRYRRDLYRKYLSENDTITAEMMRNSAYYELQDNPIKNYAPEIWERLTERFKQWF